jgi:hypothetical protein
VWEQASQNRLRELAGIGIPHIVAAARHVVSDHRAVAVVRDDAARVAAR